MLYLESLLIACANTSLRLAIRRKVPIVVESWEMSLLHDATFFAAGKKRSLWRRHVPCAGAAQEGDFGCCKVIWRCPKFSEILGRPQDRQFPGACAGAPQEGDFGCCKAIWRCPKFSKFLGRRQDRQFPGAPSLCSSCVSTRASQNKQML